MSGVQQVSFTSPYAADELDIERRRKLAEALQTQGMTPLGPTEQVGGWAIRRSPLEGIGKMAQQFSGAYQEKLADDKQKELAARSQTDLANVLAQAGRAATGTPGSSETIMDEQANGGAGAPAQINAPAVAPNRERMIQALMSHPATQPIAMQQMSSDLSAQQLQATLAGAGYGPQGGAPGAPGAGSPSLSPVPGAAPGGAPVAQGGIPEGVDPLAWALMVQKGDTAGLAKLVQEAANEQNKPQNVRPGGTIAVRNRQTGKWEQQYYSGVVGEGMTRSPQGAASVIPGFLEGQAAVGREPLQQVTNADQTISYIPKSQLAGAANASPIPQAPQAAPPVASPSGPTPNNFGNIRPPGASTGFQQFGTPAEGLAAVDKNLQAYGAKGINTIDGIINRWAPPSENNTAAYIAGVAKRLGVDPKQPLDMQNPAIRQALGTAIMLHEKGPALFAAQSPPAPSGPPKFGQTQEEQIRQAREQAAGKEVDQTFAKDYVAFATGGAQDAAKQISQLGDVVKQLNTPGTRLTGPLIGSVPDAALKFNATGRNAIAMRERVEEVVQRSLRAILGAQFTEKEGERLIARAYNPNLSEKENAIRVGRLATQLQQAFASKQDAASYFQKNNTLQGWQGKMPSMADFDPESRSAGSKIGAPQISPATREFLKQQGISVD